MHAPQTFKLQYIHMDQNKIHIRKEEILNYEPEKHLWPLSSEHHKWRVQIKLLMGVGMKTEIERCP